MKITMLIFGIVIMCYGLYSKDDKFYVCGHMWLVGSILS